jgi:hypothetical protein
LAFIEKVDDTLYRKQEAITGDALFFFAANKNKNKNKKTMLAIFICILSVYD